MRYIIRHIFIFTGILIFVAFLSRISKTALYDGFFSKIQEISVRNSQSVQVPALSETRVLSDSEPVRDAFPIKISGFFHSHTAISEILVAEIAFAHFLPPVALSRIYFGMYPCRAP